MEKIRYLNVDCILTSEEQLSELVTFLNNEVTLLWNESSNGAYSVGFETKLINTQNPEEDISKFLSILKALPSHLAKLVQNCSEKTFDVGFESGNTAEALDSKIDAIVIADVAKLGFAINIRIYPLFESAKKINGVSLD